MVIATGRSASAGAAECKFPNLRRAAEIMRSAWHAYWKWRYRDMTLRLLRSMDKRLMRDIGVDPLHLRSILRTR